MIRVLYIEDDAMIGKSTYQLLQHEKFQVDWAQTGLQALDLLFRNVYHIALLDLGLPELDGLEILKHIRKKADLNRMGVIIISARDQSKDKILGLKLGADDYLIKPYDFEELTARIESVLRRSHLSIDEEIYQQNMLNAFGDVGDEEMYRLYTGYIDDENVEDDDKLCQLRDDLCDFLFFVGKECYGNKELLMELMK